MTGENKYYIIKMYESTFFKKGFCTQNLIIGRSDLLKNLVSASILSANMLKLEEEVKRLESSNIDMLHFDVMDGVFVNNISYGLPILSAIHSITDMTLDVHLMITDPIVYVRRFAENGADIISFHLESKSNAYDTIREIRNAGAKPAIAVKPATPAEDVYEYLPLVDMVLVMTVEPGFGGQSFMADMTDKIEKIRSEITRRGLDIDIQVDGGINDSTSALVKKAGANILVSGSYLFKAENMTQAALKIKE